MSRIPTPTIEGTPDVSRPLLQDLLRISPTGGLLSLRDLV
jgi:hypothetical protein